MARTFFTLMMAVGMMLSAATTASAQFIGTFTWKQDPYCNRLVLNVSQVGNVFTIDGYDDQCGDQRRGSVLGTGFQNPNGTFGLAMSIVMTPGGSPTHIDARITLATLSGQWFDSGGRSGNFTFNGGGGGPQRPLGAVSSPLEINSTLSALSELRVNAAETIPDIVGYRVAGTHTAPLATPINSFLLQVGGGGFGGTNFSGHTGGMVVFSSEQFTDTAHGTSVLFTATPNGASGPTARMMIEHSGDVGIGSFGVNDPPLEKLHVEGDVRVGTSGTNGCVKNNNGGMIAGTACASDLRFKRGIMSYPSMLDRVTKLRPVQFYWRAAEFADRGFGDAREDGLIAQEVEQALPELVTTDADGYKAVNYSRLPLLAIQAIKELKDNNDALARELAAIQTALKELTTGRDRQ